MVDSPTAGTSSSGPPVTRSSLARADPHPPPPGSCEPGRAIRSAPPIRRGRSRGSRRPCAPLCRRPWCRPAAGRRSRRVRNVQRTRSSLDRGTGTRLGPRARRRSRPRQGPTRMHGEPPRCCRRAVRRNLLRPGPTSPNDDGMTSRPKGPDVELLQDPTERAHVGGNPSAQREVHAGDGQASA